MDVLHNLLRGHPEWNLSGPICQITNSFDFRIWDINKLNWKVFILLSGWGSYSTFSSCPAFFFLFFLESHPPPPNSRGQGWFPVILANSANDCCSTSTSIKLFLSCSALTESTAHNCCPRGLPINHADSVNLCMRVNGRTWARARTIHLFFLRVIFGCGEHSFCPLDPGNANGPSKRSAGKWGIEEPFHSRSSLSTYISPLHFPFHARHVYGCWWFPFRC